MTLLAISFGVSGLIVSAGFIHDIYIQLGEAIIHSQTGHIQVFKRGLMEGGTRHPEKYLVANSAEVVQRLEKVANVEQVAARLNFSGVLNNGHRDLAIIGEAVEPQKEQRLGTLLTIQAGRHLEDTDTFGMLVGEGVARTLNLKPGDHLTLVMNTPGGALNTLELELVGVFRSFSKDFDARAIRIPLPAAQQLMITKGANLLVITLTSTKDTITAQNAISKQINHELEARNWRELSGFYDSTVQLYDRQFGILQFIILIMVLLSVINSVNMSAFERMGEFGTMQALGNRPLDLFKLLVVENAYLGLIGGLIGVSVGVGTAVLVSKIGIPMPPPPNANLGYIAQVRLVPDIILEIFLLGIIATMAAAIVPAYRVAGTPVVDALRQSV